MPRFTISNISNNGKIGYVSENDSEPNTMTIIDETETISSTQKNKQVFSPKQTFPPKPYVEVPPPNHLDIEEFMPKKPGGKKTSNAFIIYRTVFAKVLMEKDYQNKMTDVSRWAAISWRNEKAELVTEYKKFAEEIQSTHKKRSQIAMTSRNRRIAATTPRENPAPISIPSQLNPPRREIHEIQTFHPNLIIEQQVPNIIIPYEFSIPQGFNLESSVKEFQANDSIPAFDEFDQSPISSTIEEIFYGQDFDPFLYLQQQPQEFYPGIQSIYENNVPFWFRS